MEDSKFQELLEKVRNHELLPKYLGDDYLTVDQTLELLSEQSKPRWTPKQFEEMFTAKHTNVCSTCGFDWSGPVGYSCPAVNCPIQPKITGYHNG